jgi:hypothetical protein
VIPGTLTKSASSTKVNEKTGQTKAQEWHVRETETQERKVKETIEQE